MIPLKWLGFRRPTVQIIPPGWALLRLGEISSTKGGGRLGFTENDYKLEGFPSFCAGGQNGLVDIAEYEGEAVILSSIGEQCGKAFYADGKWTTLANVQVISPDLTKANCYYLWNLLNDRDFWPRAQTAQPYIRPSDIRKSWIVLPPKSEQDQIALLFRAADDAIVKAKVKLEAARVLKRSLTAELLQPTKGTHWDKTTFASLVSEKIRNGYSPACPQDPTGAWVLSLDALTDDGFNPHGVKPAPVEDKGLLPFRLLLDDILVSRSNTPELVGRSGRYIGTPEVAYYPDLMMRVRVNYDLVSPEFAEMLLQSSNARRWLKSRASGTSGSMVKIKRRDIMSLPVLLPDTTQQNEIVRAVSAAKGAFIAAENNLSALHRVKKSLLQNLLTGKIRIPEGVLNV